MVAATRSPVGPVGLPGLECDLGLRPSDLFKAPAPHGHIELVADLDADPLLVEGRQAEPEVRVGLGGEAVDREPASLGADVLDQPETPECHHDQHVDLGDADALTLAVGEKQDRSLLRCDIKRHDRVLRVLLREVAELELGHILDLCSHWISSRP